MPPLPQQYVQQLCDRGVVVSKALPQTHVLPYAIMVGKPSTTEGNSVPGYKIHFRECLLDAPTVFIYAQDGSWIVYAQDGVPLPGDGDFENAWDTPELAVADILDFYFGDPQRMHAKICKEPESSP